MQFLAREPVGSGEGLDAAPELTLLAFHTFDFGLVRGE
jgi:hypothetical protein